MLSLSILVSMTPAQNPKIGRATRAQIVAVLPTSLRVVDRPDPRGEKRYARLLQLASRLDDPTIEKGLTKNASEAEKNAAVRKALPTLAATEWITTGPIRMPGSSDPLDSFPKASRLKGLFLVAALATRQAVARGDRVLCVRYAALGLQLSGRLIDGSGTVLDAITATGNEAIAERAVYDAEIRGGFDSEGKRRILSLLQPLRGPLSTAATILRGEFRASFMPVLLDPVHGWDAVYPSSTQLTSSVRPSSVGTAEKPLHGNYDPIATARLVGQMFDAAIVDAARPLNAQSGRSSRISWAAEKAMPSRGDLSEAEYDAKMDTTPNSIGNLIASLGAFDGLAKLGARRAVNRNLVHAVLLLRMGRPAVLPGPLGSGTLKTDARRRIVWSVGQNGKDDGGKIGQKAPDQGYGY